MAYINTSESVYGNSGIILKTNSLKQCFLCECVCVCVRWPSGLNGIVARERKRESKHKNVRFCKYFGVGDGGCGNYSNKWLVGGHLAISNSSVCISDFFFFLQTQSFVVLWRNGKAL